MIGSHIEVLIHYLGLTVKKNICIFTAFHSIPAPGIVAEILFAARISLPDAIGGVKRLKRIARNGAPKISVFFYYESLSML